MLPQKGRSAASRGPITSGDQIVKRMSIPGVLVTTAGGLISVVNFSSGNVQSAPATEWSSFAARYQQYRVRRLRFVATPCHPTADSTITTHSQLYVSDYIGSSIPSTPAQVLADERCTTFSTAGNVVYNVSWSRNPNARLWNPTSAVIPTANEYGFVIASNSLISMSSGANDLFAYTVEYEVEFRGSQ